MYVFTKRRRAVGGFIAVALVATACGSDDEAAPDTSGTTAVTTVTTDGTDTTDAAVTTEATATTDSTEPTDAAVTTAAAETTDTTEPADVGSDDDCTEERTGGSITVDTPAPISGLDPFRIFGTGGFGADVASAFYDTLMRYDATDQTFQPQIAESLEPNDDNTVWTMKLRDGVTFGNGDQLTTEDVKASFERMQTSTVRAAGMAALITGIEIVDDLEIVMTLSSAFNFPYMMATELGWIPNNDLVTQRGDGFHIDPAGAGAGPFEVVKVSETAGEEILMEARDDYWGGPVCIDSIKFISIPGAEAKLDAFQNAEIDTFFVNTNRSAAVVRDLGLLPFEKSAGMVNYVLADQGITGNGETAFNDIRVREAMQLAIDYDVLNARLYDELEPRTDSALLPESSVLYSGAEGPEYDPERAAQLVQETITDGVWDGSFTFLHEGTPERTDQAVTFKGLWDAVGMNVTLEVVPSVAGRVIADRNFEVASNGFAILDPAPWSTVNGLSCESTRQRTGFCDPEMDAAIEQLRSALTIEDTKAALADMQAVWNRTFPVVGVAHTVWGIGAQERVHGLQFGPDVTTYYATAWVDQ